MKTELKPCPFCGCSDVSIVNFETSGDPNKRDWRILCNNDKCMCMVDFVKTVRTAKGIKDYFPTKEEAIEAWNRRAKDESEGFN